MHPLLDDLNSKVAPVLVKVDGEYNQRASATS